MRILSFVAALLGIASSQATAQPALHEYDVKAAFVLNFTRYVEWPDPRRQPPFRLCTYLDNPFGRRLESLVADERWEGGPLQVRVIAELRQSAECHLVYVPNSAADAFTANAAVLGNLSVLTIGEDEEFLEHGGMIRLFVEQKRVRFSVNQKAAAAANLQISSRLLRLARAVVGTASP